MIRLRGSGGGRQRRRLVLPLLIAGTMLWLPSPVEAHLAATHQHLASVTYSVNEYIGITTTQINVRMRYYQNASDVWSPSYYDGYCWHDLVPGWTTSQCVYSIGSGSTYVQAAMQGEFHYGPIAYQQHGYIKALYDNSLIKVCYLDWGVLPAHWTSTCASARTNL